MQIPETRYATTADGVHIAYQVSGRGPMDLLWSEGWLSHVEILWEYPMYARWMEMLGESFRVIHFDKRGIGLSDRTATPDLETRMEDVSSRWGREDEIRQYSRELGVRTPLHDPAFIRWAAKYMRYAASPGTVLEQGRILYDTDLRGVLPAIHVPTLLLYRPDFEGASGEEMAYLRGLIPGSRVESVAGADEQPFFGDPAEVVVPVARFVDAIRS